MLKNTLVCVKRVLDTRVTLQVESDKLVVQAEPKAVYRLNPADRYALEAAMKLKQSSAGRVIAVTVGPSNAVDILRFCLASGVDRATHVICPDEMILDAWAVTKALQKVIEKQNYDLIICGDESLDNCGGQVGPALAELLDIPQVTRVTAFEVERTRTRLIAHRVLERGNREIVESQLPALITMMGPTNEPHYVSVNRRLRPADHLIDKLDISLLEGIPEPLCQEVAVGWPRPRAKRIATLTSSMSATERMTFLMSGGQTDRRGGICDGPTDTAVDILIASLQDRGIF